MEKRRDFIKKASLLSIGLPLMGAMGCKGDTKGAAAVKSEFPRRPGRILGHDGQGLQDILRRL